MARSCSMSEHRPAHLFQLRLREVAQRLRGFDARGAFTPNLNLLHQGEINLDAAARTAEPLPSREGKLGVCR
jgi:hypothetical protein